MATEVFIYYRFKNDGNIGWLVYNLTNDPFAIGLIGLSEVIPAVSLTLYAGHVMNKWKEKLLLRGVILYFTAAAMLFFINNFYIAALNQSLIAICIYAVIFGTGIIRAFTSNGTGVMVAYIVPKNYYKMQQHGTRECGLAHLLQAMLLQVLGK